MNNKVFVYCRKSQESEERQALSIPSQIEELEKLAKRDGLDLIKPYYQESQSAKKPGRPIFNKMLKDMEAQGVDTLVVWNPDRLSRNSVDTGQIIYLMDLGVLQRVITPNQIFSSTPNDKFLFNILCGQAKLENDNRGINAKRGMTTKANMGWYPAPAPLGYKNTPDRKKGFKVIEIDEERFVFVKRLFEEILFGKQASEVYKEAANEWKLTSGFKKVLSRSTFYNLLNKPFYYGEYEWPDGSGIWYEGKHTPMITKEQYITVQKLLGRMGTHKARPQKLDFDLTGLFRCSVCGCAMTATKKKKYYRGTKRTAEYTYYYCTRKNRGVKCNSLPLTETNVVDQIKEKLYQVQPDQEFITWSKKWLSVIYENDLCFEEEKKQSKMKSLENIDTQLNNLLDLRLNGLIDDSKYKEKAIALEQQKQDAEKTDVSKVDPNEKRMEVENSLDFALACLQKFKTGQKNDKHEVLIKISKNLLLKPTKLLEIDLKKEYGVLADSDNWSERYKSWREPQKYTEIMEKRPDLRPANPCWLPRVDSNHEPTA